MGARTLYPAPPCPNCGKNGRVKNTAYTRDGQILRNRGCDWCGHSWWTQQAPEVNVDPERMQIKLPRSQPGWRQGGKQWVELVSIDLLPCTADGV